MIELSENISSYVLHHFGPEYLAAFRDYFYGEYKPYLRLSDLYSDPLITIEALKNYGIELKKIEAVRSAYMINSGTENAGKTLEFMLGKYYIQSLSSMIPALVLNPSKDDRVLDLCAAPGSKTTLLAELMENKGTLYANEISLERLKGLVFNLEKMSLVNVGVIKNKGELLSKAFGNYFDKILVDVPCSGLGIVQKKGEVSNWWSLERAEKIADLQTRLLVSAVKMAKEGAEIIYSTCTITLEENELVLNKILRKYPVVLEEFELPVPSHPGYTEYEGEKLNPEISKAKRIIPWEVNSEGFFIAKLRKISETEKSDFHYPREKKYELIEASSRKIKEALIQLGKYYGIDISVFADYKYLIKNNDIFFVDKNWTAFDLSMFERIGSRFGLIDKRGAIQLNSLAAQILGAKIKNNLFELHEISEIETYMSGGTIKKEIAETGQKVIKYKNNIIGTAVATSEGLKSQFPRSFRTQEINLNPAENSFP